LMQGVLVFASAAARNAAITSPQEGQFAFTKDTNGLWYYDGAAWVASGATGDIEGVTAGVGISGGGTSGTVTVTNSMATAIDAKGDLVPGTGADTFSRLAVGANNTVLTADSAEATGMKWATPASGSTAVGVTAFTSTAQNTTSGTATVINLNSEAFDTDSMHSTATNTSRLTISTGKGGYYLVNVLTLIDAGGNDVFITILKNGTTITGYGQWNNNRMAASNYGGAGYVVAWGSQTYPLAAGDYIEVAVQCAKATGANCLNMTFSAMYLGA